jgi:hypothetical protein
MADRYEAIVIGSGFGGGIGQPPATPSHGPVIARRIDRNLFERLARGHAFILLPSAVGANPTATIPAVSERVAGGITGIDPDGDLYRRMR